MYKQHLITLVLCHMIVSCTQAMEEKQSDPVMEITAKTLTDEIAKRAARKPVETMPQEQAQLTKEPKKQELILTFESFTEFLTRVQFADKTIQDQTASLQPLVAQQKKLDDEQIKLDIQFAAVLKKKKPVQDEMLKLAAEKRNLVNQEAKLEHTKQAAYRLCEAFIVEAVLEKALKDATKQQLTPLLVDQLATQKKELKGKIATVITSWKAYNQQLNPLNSQEKELIAVLERNKTVLSELRQDIESIETTKMEAELEKTALFKALDQKLAVTIEAKQKLEAEVKAISATIKEETDTKQKIALRTELATKERAIGEHQQTITDLKIARAQADGTYSKLSWLAGTYN